jgi:SulP family sulfate permease
MAFTTTPTERHAIGSPRTISLRRLVPALDWMGRYQRKDLSGDLLAGLIVAVMLVPQAMAYAQLAGLPPAVGLYASIVPLLLYGVLGSSRVLSVGPVAIDSLLVAAAVGPLVAGAGLVLGTPEAISTAIQLALTLAFMVGIIELVMGLLRLGFIVNFISQPVLVGFMNAAALVIAFSQVKTLLGVKVPSSERFFEQLWLLAINLASINWVTLAISALSIAILLFFRGPLGGLLQKWGLGPSLAMTITRSAPLLAVLVGTLLVRSFALDTTAGVRIVGAVPAGLPPLTLPSFDLATLRTLLPAALAIAAVGYMEAISTAKSLARKRRETIDSDQELVALGAANLGAAFTGGYPVTGGLSRSAVNHAAGARTGLASMTTAGLVAVAVLLLTPLFYSLPSAVLASIIVVAVTNLFDFKTVRLVARYSKADFAALLATFLSVLILGVATGILVGAALSLVLYLWRTSRPHIAVVGRLGEGEHYRNVLRYDVQTWPDVVLLRMDESLYFANAGALSDAVMAQVADECEVRHVVLIASAINTIDVTALDMLKGLVADLHRQGIDFHLTDVKGPVMDKLEAIGFVEQIGRDHVHLSAHAAMCALGKLAAPATPSTAAVPPRASAGLPVVPVR